MASVWERHPLKLPVDSYVHWFNGLDCEIQSGSQQQFVPVRFRADTKLFLKLFGGIDGVKQFFFSPDDDKPFFMSWIYFERLKCAPVDGIITDIVIYFDRSVFQPSTDVQILNNVLILFGSFPFSIGLSISGRAMDSTLRKPDPEKIAQRQKSDRLPQADGVVVTAIIDDGLAFANERFLKGLANTRIEYFWNQGSLVDDAASVQCFGSELNKFEIDELLIRYGRGGVIDELAIYKEVGLVNFKSADEQPAALRRSHGTHVMDLACGFDHRDPNDLPFAQKNPIIAVQLRSETVENTNGVGLVDSVEQAIDCVLYRSQCLAHRMQDGNTEFCEVAPLPTIINFSFGTYAGRHDGLSRIELFLDDLLDRESNVKAVTLPAGNSHLLRTHAVVEKDCFNSSKERSLGLIVQPDNKAVTFVQIWLTGDVGEDPTRLRVTVTPPWGPPSDAGPESREDFGKHGCYEEWRDGDTLRARIYYQVDDVSEAEDLIPSVLTPADIARLKLTLAIQPTVADEVDQATAPSGKWTITLHDNGIEEGEEVHLWVERGDTPTGYRQNGRQSHFEDDKYQLFVTPGDHDQLLTDIEECDNNNASPIIRLGTLSALATGQRTTVVGGYREFDGRVAFYSSAGPALEHLAYQPRIGPDLAAPSDDSRALRGLLATGTFSGSRVSAAGTSFASAVVARYAVEFARTRTTAAEVKQALVAQAKNDDPTHRNQNSVPCAKEQRTGSGRIGRTFKDGPPRRPNCTAD